MEAGPGSSSHKRILKNKKIWTAMSSGNMQGEAG